LMCRVVPICIQRTYRISGLAIIGEVLGTRQARLSLEKSKRC
jgi:hypothetical protein